MKVDLQDVIEAIEFENEYLSHYYNKNTGVIIYKEDKDAEPLNNLDLNTTENFEDWQKELLMELKDLEEHPENYIELPSHHELHEGRMMKKFIDEHSIKCDADENNIEALKKAIEAKALLSEWYDFREDLERQIAIDWCERNNIEY